MRLAEFHTQHSLSRVAASVSSKMFTRFDLNDFFDLRVEFVCDLDLYIVTPSNPSTQF